MLFEVKEVDKQVYENRIKNFIPDKIIDVHTHLWQEKPAVKKDTRVVSWPMLIAKDNSAKDLIEGYRLLFPSKKVTPLIFGVPDKDKDLDKENEYIRKCSEQFGFPALMLTRPEWTAGKIKENIIVGGFLGTKVYLNLSPEYIPGNEIRIFDFLPPYLLVVTLSLWLLSYKNLF